MLTLSDFKILRSCFLFEDVGSNELFKLNAFLAAENCKVVQFKKDELIFGESGSYQLGILLGGKATAVCSEGDKSALKSFSEGEVFGAAGVFCEETNTCFSKVKAISSCRVLFIGRECIEKLIKSNPERAIKYIEFLSNRVEFLNNRIATFTSNQAVSRLAKYILENADAISEEEISFAALARILDISRASFYRAKNELEEAGAAMLDAKKITLLNEEILRSYLG